MHNGVDNFYPGRGPRAGWGQLWDGEFGRKIEFLVKMPLIWADLVAQSSPLRANFENSQSQIEWSCESADIN